MVALIQSKNHATNKGKTAGRFQFDTHPTGIGLKSLHSVAYWSVQVILFWLLFETFLV